MIDLLGPAQRCLAFFESHWDAKGWDLPKRRYIAAGSASAIADESEQFVVGLTSISPGSGSREGIPAKGQGAMSPPKATYAARLIRCAHVSDQMMADADALHADGLQSLLDAGRILSTLMAWCRAEPISISLNAMSLVGQLEPVGPEGAVMGHVAPFTVGPLSAVPD